MVNKIDLTSTNEVDIEYESNNILWMKLLNLKTKLLVNKMNGSLLGFEISWIDIIKYSLVYAFAKIVTYYLEHE